MITRKYAMAGGTFLIAIALLTAPGCRKNSTGPDLSGVSSNQDAAQSIANAVGEDNGGVADQMGDIADATGGSAGISANVGSYFTEAALLKSAATTGDSISKTFNTSDTSWTVYVSRSRVGLLGRQAGFTRTYYIKFIDPTGKALPRFATASPADTASTIVFKVLSGTGYTETLHAGTHLLSVTADYVVTGANTSTITVNGSFTRTGTDTINTSASSERVLNHTLTATLTNVTGPRTPRYQLASRIPRATGGTITGTYSATVTVVRGDSYTERSFTKNFQITFGTDGSADIGVNGSRFVCNTADGELN